MSSLVQDAWTLVVFFAMPLIVAENRGLISGLKRSLAIFKQTWGEGFIGSTAIAGFSCLGMLGVLVVGGGLIALGICRRSG